MPHNPEERELDDILSSMGQPGWDARDEVPRKQAGAPEALEEPDERLAA